MSGGALARGAMALALAVLGVSAAHGDSAAVPSGPAGLQSAVGRCSEKPAAHGGPQSRATTRGLACAVLPHLRGFAVGRLDGVASATGVDVSIELAGTPYRSIDVTVTKPGVWPPFSGCTDDHGYRRVVCRTMPDGTLVEIDQRVATTRGEVLDSLYDGHATRKDGGQVFVQVFTRAPRADALRGLTERILADPIITWHIPDERNHLGQELEPFGTLTYEFEADPDPR